MPIATLISLLPLALSGVSEIVALVQKLQADGRTQTTDEETAVLQVTLSNLAIADGAFDAAFKDVQI